MTTPSPSSPSFSKGGGSIVSSARYSWYWSFFCVDSASVSFLCFQRYIELINLSSSLAVWLLARGLGTLGPVFEPSGMTLYCCHSLLTFPVAARNHLGSASHLSLRYSHFSVGFNTNPAIYQVERSVKS